MTSYTASVSGSPIFSVTYTRDALGRIETKTETIQGVTDTYEYDYDLAGRLTDVTKNSVAVAHYEYDANGNRVSDANADGNKTFNHAGTLLSTTYDVQDRLISSTVGPSTSDYQYTDNGELTIKTDASGTATYTYNLLGNLTHVELPNGDDIEYVIDGRDRRLGKKVNSALTQGLLFEGQLTPIAELDGSNQVVGRFVYASKANIPDYVIRGSTTYRIVSDHLGSPRLVIETATGAVVQRTDYDEFGNIVFENVAGGFGEGVETGYQVEFLPSGNQQRTTFLPNDTELVVVIGVDGSDIITQPTGVLQTMQQGPDPRLGMQAPVDQTTTVTNPR